MRNLAVLSCLALAVVVASAQHERIVGGPCEGCEAVFEGLPANLLSSARLAPEGEPGEALTVAGVVTTAAGAPAPGIIVYAYQTNAAGVYPPAASIRGSAARHGRLRGWAKTDASGAYRFETVRPGGYPGTDIPQHIHLHVIEPGRCTYYIDDVLFEDDPRLTPEQRRAHERRRAGSGVARPTRNAGGGWRVQRDIQLGLNISDYGRCGS